jgi:hypothetical protein
VASLDEINLNDEPLEIAHPFEAEINSLVRTNHRLAAEGVTRLEEEDIAGTRKHMADDDPELLRGAIAEAERKFSVLQIEPYWSLVRVNLVVQNRASSASARHLNSGCSSTGKHKQASGKCPAVCTLLANSNRAK